MPEPAVRSADRTALETHALTKHFGAVVALDSVSITVGQGESVAIVGDNGAGKSTLVKLVSGLYEPTGGAIRIDGEPVAFANPKDARGHGIEVVYQDLALAEVQEVYMNLYLGREVTTGPLRRLDRATMRSATAHALEALQVRIPSVDAMVSDLSGGQRQGVAIARAMHWARHLVLMDEPTASLGVKETARVEDAIQAMRRAGRSILLISHNLDQVFRLADRIYVLRRGRLVGARRCDETTGEEIVGLITGAIAGDAAA